MSAAVGFWLAILLMSLSLYIGVRVALNILGSVLRAIAGRKPR